LVAGDLRDQCPEDLGAPAVRVLVEERVVLVEASWAFGSRRSRSITRAPVEASTLRSSACAQTAPKLPVVAPTTAAGLPCRGVEARGRDAQSIAFLRTPGMEELYSGVAIRTASESAIARRRSATEAGAGSVSSSWS
jgi:hypothetical protein